MVYELPPVYQKQGKSSGAGHVRGLVKNGPGRIDRYIDIAQSRNVIAVTRHRQAQERIRIRKYGHREYVPVRDGIVISLPYSSLHPRSISSWSARPFPHARDICASQSAPKPTMVSRIARVLV